MVYKEKYYQESISSGIPTYYFLMRDFGIGKDCKNCYLNTTIFGTIPPGLKFRRVYDGYAGGAQWPGVSIDLLNNYLIVASNNNLIAETFSDYVPSPKTLLPQNQLLPMRTPHLRCRGRILLQHDAPERKAPQLTPDSRRI